MTDIARRFYKNGYLRQRRLEMMHRGELGDFFALFKILEERNAKDLELFFRNNKAFLTLTGMTEAEQVRVLKKRGFHTASSTLSLMRRGKLKKASLSYLQAFSNFWNISVGNLLSIDYGAEIAMKNLQEELQSR